MDTAEESIYKIIPMVEPPPMKHPLHKSKHNPKCPPTGSTFGLAQTSKPGVVNIQGEEVEPQGSNHIYKKNLATFGPPPGSIKPEPVTYLKKGTFAKPVEPLQTIRKSKPELLQPSTLKTKLRPPVPATSDKPVMNLVSDKNFITSNAVDVILAAPHRPAPRPEDRDYMKKADYGKVPQYLTQIKADITQELEYIQKLQEEEDEKRRSQIKLMPEEQRQELIENLKAKWEKVNRDYQGQTHLTNLDTIGKRRRKENYEQTLQQIERDIEKLNKGYIFEDREY